MEDNEDISQPVFDFTSRLYDPAQSKEANFGAKRNYLLLKITEDDLQVEDPSRIFRRDTKYVTKVGDIFEHDTVLDVMFIDTHENSAHAVYLKNFRKYKPTFFGCEERVFFEALLVKHKSFGGEFSWSIQQCEKELGIKRSARETIIKRLIQLGIIETGTIPIPGEQMKSITQFKVNIQRVIELIPEIFDDQLTNLLDIERYIHMNYLES